MKTFKFNEYGVCLNPNLTEWRSETSRSMWKIETAQTPAGTWVYGSYFWTGKHGRSFGASLNSEQCFATEKRALIAASRSLHEELLHEEEGVTATMLNTVKELYMNQLQASLF